MTDPVGASRFTELEPGSAEEAVFQAMQEIYSQTLAGEVAVVTDLMHPEITLWDSEIDALAFGVPHLQELRGRDPLGTASVMPESLEASEAVVTVWGDTALLRHILTVRFSETDMADIHIRNTSVWRLVDGRWLMAHNHEDVWPGN